MTEWIYQTLEAVGYTHPLHPTMTHLPVGMVMAMLVFGIMARVLNNENLVRTARHCTMLALIGVIPTIILGYMDWQYRFAGAWLFPIQAKLGLAFALVVLLIAAVIVGRQKVPRRFTGSALSRSWGSPISGGS